MAVCWRKMVLDELSDLDQAVYGAIARSPTPHLDRVMARLSDAANYSRLSLAAAAVLALTRGDEGRRAATLGLVRSRSPPLWSTSRSAARTSRPPRPGSPPGAARPAGQDAEIDVVPSGHTAAAFAFAGGVSDVLPWEGAALHVLATAVGYSRVHTGVHYPSDVIFGALIGTVTSRIVVERLTRGERTRCASAPREPANSAPEPAPTATSQDGRGRSGPVARGAGS